MIILKWFFMIPRWRCPMNSADRNHWHYLVTAILKLLVTGRREGDYQLVSTDHIHRITWSVFCLLRTARCAVLMFSEQNRTLSCTNYARFLFCDQQPRHWHRLNTTNRPYRYNGTYSWGLTFVAVWHDDTLDWGTGIVLDLREQLWPWLLG